MKKKILILGILSLSFTTIFAQYISEIIEYKPAPGQFINTDAWGKPQSAESLIGGIMGHVTLGAFGGYIIFKFENPVDNHPENPYGVDFIIYGNPLNNIANPQIDNLVTWSEPGIVSVMKDENCNGLPDDTWYELAGSDYYFSSTIKNYQVKYTNPKQDTATDVAWIDNLNNQGFVFANVFHDQPYYPKTEFFSNIDQENYTLSGTRVADYVDQTNPSYVTCFGRPWGYVDNTLRGTFDGIPDNPYTRTTIEHSGGDGFDINWAVDDKGNYVNLDKIDFIKVHNGILANAGWLGEVSTEIAGAFDVAPNSDITGQQLNIVVKELPKEITQTETKLECFVFNTGRLITDKKISWQTNNEAVNVSNNSLTVTKTIDDDITATVSLTDNPEVRFTINTHVKVTITGDDGSGDDDSGDDGSGDDDNNQTTYIDSNTQTLYVIYPNPADNQISISNIDNASIYIYNTSSRMFKQVNNYNQNSSIDISNLPKGLYIIRVKLNSITINIKFIKR